MNRRIDLVFPVLPPVQDGIGDYTARLAEALSTHADVGILTGAEPPPADVAGAEVVTALRRGARLGLVEAVRRRRPDWLVLQYNPFSYGRRGYCPYLPKMLLACRRAAPGTRVAVMFHERYVPFIDFRFAVMSAWQRPQFAALGATADVAFFSIEAWTEAYRRRHPERSAVHLPVGSNIPRVGADRGAVRRALGLTDDTVVLGLFGSAHASRLLPLVEAAAAAVRARCTDAALLYVGPHGAAVREAVASLPVLDAGLLPPDEVSAHLSAMDVALAPFVDGLSTRRGSAMAGLQHGVATVATRAFHTDGVFVEADGRALVLTPPESAPFAEAAAALAADPERRRAVGAAGARLYDQAFAWPVVAERLLASLAEAEAAP